MEDNQIDFVEYNPIDLEKYNNINTISRNDLFSPLYIEPEKTITNNNNILQEDVKKDIKIINNPTISNSEKSTEIKKPIKVGNVKLKKDSNYVDRISEFINLAKEEGINFKITSGLRKGAKTKSGKTSWHATGDAIDIVPIDGNWDNMIKSFKSNDKIYSFLKNNNLGILDETSPEMLKKTGGTGAHWHIGPDQIALLGLEKIYKGQKGLKFLKYNNLKTSDINNNFSEINSINDFYSKVNSLNNNFSKINSAKSNYTNNDEKEFNSPIITSPDWGKKSTYIEKQEKALENNFIKDDDLYLTKFDKKNIKNFTKVMTKVYSDVLDEMGLPKNNLLNLVKQSALESDYGVSPRGNGYNLGGIKNFTGDKSKGTIYEGDNISYLNFKDLKDYAKYKVKLLNNMYDAIDARSTEDFINRLHGKNINKKNYSANKESYINNFNGMISLEKAFNELTNG